MESSISDSGSPVSHRYNTRYKKRNTREYSEIIEKDEPNSDSDSDTLFNIYEYRKMLSNLFPSRYMNKRIKDTKRF